MRLMSLHCLRDAVDVKPDLMVSNAADIVEKVRFRFYVNIFTDKNFAPYLSGIDSIFLRIGCKRGK